MTDTARLRVLVVDDEVDNLNAFRRVFRKEFDVAIAGSGFEAMELARSSPFDAVVSDYSMPGMDGIQLLQQLAVIQPSMARLIVTGHADLVLARSSRIQGLVATVISKPWQKSNVAGWIETTCRLARMRESIGHLKVAIRDGT